MLEQKANSKQLNLGFTLVELMITLAVAAIIVTAAVPSFMSIIASNRVTAASNELVTALNIAKSEAIRSGQYTVLCKSADGSNCDSTKNWSDGWLLFNDANDDQRKQDSEQVIRVHGASEPSLGFIYRTANYIKFSPTGGINEHGRFCFRNSYKDENSRAIHITQAGRIRTQVAIGSNDDCAA